MPPEWSLKNHGNILAALRTPTANEKIRGVIDELRKKIALCLTTFHGGTGDHKDGKNVPNFGEEIKRLLEQQVRKYDWFFNPRKFL